ncbi:MFS transporter [Curtobacterium sp. BRB10]|uniref:MFS transporter n=1 Tax=Curtobacterium sp. BRB10 TaxID=2962579 RepID=UPI0037BF827D
MIRSGTSLNGNAYRQLFTTAAVRQFFLRSVPGRFGTAAASLAVVVAAQTISGSYAVAGAAAAVLAVSNAICAPLGAIIAARTGQWRVLYANAVIVLVAAAGLIVAERTGSTAILIGAVTLLGVGMPQIGAVAVSRWSTLIADPRRLRAAFAIESMMNEVTFLTGPILVSVAVAAGGAALAPAGCACLIAATAALVAAARASEPPRSRTARSDRDYRRGMRAPIVVVAAAAVVNFAIGGFFGSAQVSVVATATSLGAADVSSAMYALMSATGIVAGFGYGAIHRTAKHARIDLIAGLACIAVVAAVAATITSVAALAVVLLLAGIFTAPSIIAASVIVEQATPAHQVQSVFTVLTSMSSAGSATGAALSGILIEAIHPEAGFAISAALATLGLCAALLLLRRTRDAHTPRKSGVR